MENKLLRRHGYFRFLILVTVTVCVSLSACTRDPEVRKQRYYDRGMEYFESQKLDEAAIEFRNALQVDPRFAEAGTMLAKVQYLRGEFTDIYRLLLNAVDAKPDYFPARLALGGFYLAGGRITDALQEANYVLERSPNDLEALVLLADCLAREGEFQEAEETLQRALEIDPGFQDALHTLAMVKIANRQLPEAEALLRQVIDNAPEAPEGYLRLAGFLGITGRAAEAEVQLLRAVDLSKDSAETLGIQQNYYMTQQKWGEAEAVARKIQSLYGSEEKHWTTVADFYILRRDWDQARAELERLLREHRNPVVIQRKLVEVHLGMGNEAKAQEINDAILQKNPQDALAHLAKGRMLFAGGDFNNALLELNQTRQYQPDLPVLHFWYGVIYAQRGELEQAKQALAEALKYDANYWPARQVLAELQNRTGAPDAALMNAREILRRNPRNVQAALLMSQAFIVKRDFEQAERLLQAILEQAPENPQGRWQLGVLELQKGNFSSAREQLEQVWDAPVGTEPALMATVMSYLMEKQPNQALGFLDQQIASRPELASDLYRMRGRVNQIQRKPEEAIEDYSRVLAANPPDSGTAIALAYLYADNGKMEQAIRLLQDTQQRSPRDPRLPMATARLFERSAGWQDAQRSYERALALGGDRNPVLLNNLAWILAEHGGNIDLAVKYAQQAKELQADNVIITNTIGWIFYKKNSYELAFRYLQEAATKAPTNPLYQYQLGMVAVKMGKTAEARRAFEKALQLDPQFPQAEDARKTLAEL